MFSLSDCPYFLRYVAICLLPLFSSLWRHKFCSLPQLSCQFTFLHNQESQDKNVNILKALSRIRTWDTGPGTLRPGTLELGCWDTDTQDPGPGTLELATCDPETQNLESRTLRIEVVTQIRSILTRSTDCINFNYEANFDNKKLGHLSGKRRVSSGQTRTFTKIFGHLT